MVDQSTQERGGFTSFRDMFDGGGPGRSGERFEGGGVLSAIGNAFGGPGGGGFDPGRAAGSMMGGMAFGPVGGLLGGLIGQNMGRGGYGYTDAMGNQVSAGMDMFDGGGRGMAGDTFQGGPFSGLLNALGVRPRGYDARQAAMASAEQGAPSLMSQPVQQPAPAAPVPQTYGMTSMPTLTMDQIQRLRELGIDTNAMGGETATAAEMAALLRGPGMLLSMGQPNAMTSAPMQPGMNVMPDGEAFLRQNLAVIPALTGPSMTMPRSDIGTIRPYVSRSTGRIPPMMDLPPLRGVTNPPPMLLPR